MPSELRLNTFIFVFIFNQCRIPLLSPPPFANSYPSPWGNCLSSFPISCSWTVDYNTAVTMAHRDGSTTLFWSITVPHLSRNKDCSKG